jgi:hypothetical protein
MSARKRSNSSPPGSTTARSPAARASRAEPSSIGAGRPMCATSRARSARAAGAPRGGSGSRLRTTPSCWDSTWAMDACRLLLGPTGCGSRSTRSTRRSSGDGAAAETQPARQPRRHRPQGNDGELRQHLSVLVALPLSVSAARGGEEARAPHRAGTLAARAARRRAMALHPGMYPLGRLLLHQSHGRSPPKPYEYLSYDFTNKSADVMDLFVTTCGTVGVATRVTCDSRGIWHVRINRRPSVALMLKNVGRKA